MYSKRRHHLTVLSKDDKSACVLRLVDVLSVVNFEPCVFAHLIYTIFQERRKSRDDQRRDLVLLENREETWRNQIEDKNSEIIDLSKRIAVCIFSNTYWY